MHTNKIQVLIMFCFLVLNLFQLPAKNRALWSKTIATTLNETPPSCNRTFCTMVLVTFPTERLCFNNYWLLNGTNIIDAAAQLFGKLLSKEKFLISKHKQQFIVCRSKSLILLNT